MLKTSHTAVFPKLVFWQLILELNQCFKNFFHFCSSVGSLSDEVSSFLVLWLMPSTQFKGGSQQQQLVSKFQQQAINQVLENCVADLSFCSLSHFSNCYNFLKFDCFISRFPDTININPLLLQDYVEEELVENIKMCCCWNEWKPQKSDLVVSVAVIQI